MTILSQNGAHVKSFCISAENSNVFEKRPWWSLPFSKVAVLEVTLQFHHKRTPA